jgi:hypothetical protein
VIFPVPLCVPITWSIDTTGLSHPGRTSVAVGRAFDEWSAATGLRFQWVSSGGQVSVVFHPVDPRWLAYALEDVIVVDPVVANAASTYQREVVAHELGHVLGLPHGGPGLMGGNAIHVMPIDGQAVSIQPCD